MSLMILKWKKSTRKSVYNLCRIPKNGMQNFQFFGAEFRQHSINAQKQCSY